MDLAWQLDNFAMNKYVINGIVVIPDLHQFGSKADIMQELGRLLGIGKRNKGPFAGKYVLSDMAVSKKINPDSLIRPYEIGRPYCQNLKSGGDDGQYGYDIPMTSNSSVKDLWQATWADRGRPTSWKSIEMFNGYSHYASYEMYPFKVKLVQAGSAWIAEYECHNEISGSVNPGLMDKFKSYYPAFQIFEEDNYAFGPKSVPCFNWCGAQSVGSGPCNEYLYDINIDIERTYYLIPFLSEYKFDNYPGDMGTLLGKKYCLIYKDFVKSEWTLGHRSEESSYSVHFDNFILNGHYGARVQFTLASTTNSYTSYLYVGWRVWDEVNNVEAIWFDNWIPSVRIEESVINPNSPISRYVDIDWGGAPLSANAKRVEVQLYDPSRNKYWTSDFSLTE